MSVLLQVSVDGSGPLHGVLVALTVVVAALGCAWYARVLYRRTALGALDASKPLRASTFSLSDFERAVLTRIAATSSDTALQCQLERAEILSRKYTGVGCYSHLAVPVECPKSVATYAEHGPLQGPSFESPAVELGGGTLLWFDSGRADCLEVYSYGEFFPEDHADLTDVQFSGAG
jgi:hypothetical protein